MEQRDTMEPKPVEEDSVESSNDIKPVLDTSTEIINVLSPEEKPELRSSTDDVCPTLLSEIPLPCGSDNIQSTTTNHARSNSTEKESKSNDDALCEAKETIVEKDTSINGSQTLKRKVITNEQDMIEEPIEITLKYEPTISSSTNAPEVKGVVDAKQETLSVPLSKDGEQKKQSTANEGSEVIKVIEADAEEVVVLTVVAAPNSESNDKLIENVVVTLDEENENKVSMEGEDKNKCDIVNQQQFQAINCSQESKSTKIDLISTEVVQKDVPKRCAGDSNNSAIIEANEKHRNDVERINNKRSSEYNCTHGHDIEAKEENTADMKENINAKTEVCDNKETMILDAKTASIDVTTIASPSNLKESSTIVNNANKVETSEKRRSVIQDIFDDWGVDNPEEEYQATPKVQDSVEIELKSLLDDPKTTETTTMVVVETVVAMKEESATTDKVNMKDVSIVSSEFSKESIDSPIVNNKSQSQSSIQEVSEDSATSANTYEKVSLEKPEKMTKALNQDHSIENASSKPLTKRALRQNPILTGSITSQAEVTEALKERLKRDQKIVEAPCGPDIFFVKKLTQRLSNKLANTPVNPIPALIPISSPTQSSPCSMDSKATESNNAESSKQTSSDNKELLAILEGDVDPDWSNLKPPTLTEEGKEPLEVERISHNTPPKLDPLVEREIALKQLLELPVTTPKKTIPKKKKPVKQAAQRKLSKEVSKEIPKEVPKEVPMEVVEEVDDGKDSKSDKEVVNIDLTDSDKGSANTSVNDQTEIITIDGQQEANEKEVVELQNQASKMDETRSGRKRKLTERARQHEQSTTKRQNVYKRKISIGKKQMQKPVSDSDLTTKTVEVVTNENNIPSNINIESTEPTETGKEVINKKVAAKLDSSLNKSQVANLKRSKPNLSRKGSQSISKKKVVVKKIIRPSMTNKKTLSLKSKLSSTQKKSRSKLVAKSQKRPTDAVVPDAKPKKKIINEIDRLLQDEGVVNLLYDVEQPDKKRLVPITKSQAKVMDIQKVQHELKIRKKLVRNAVLRLRTSASGASKVSSRSKRASHLTDARADQKSVEDVSPAKTTNTTANDFIIPAKIRNAADASVIVRRHSSSSFSSASGSPRVSIDGTDKIDLIKLDEGLVPTKSNKRKLSHDDNQNTRKSKKRAIPKEDAEVFVAATVEDRTVVSPRPNKKSDAKKVDKNTKQIEAPAIDHKISTPTKVMTRSNGTPAGKPISKSKKAPKNKIIVPTQNQVDNNDESGKEEDELSICLAEAATALSVVNSNSRSGNAAASRKSKVSNTSKVTEAENTKQSETQNQFINKEINVRRHGNLVQLILTPSTSTKIRNALTLPVMHEFRETLSILKKDDECRVVLFTSTGTSFCEGLELSMLLQVNKDERRQKAQEMADAVKDFIKSLASFNKPIVAGVQGVTVGLGVTMLPLFDLVIASDKATFCTPYGKLGQIAEGAAVYTLSHILGSAVTSELLLGGRTLTASEALRAGLVTRVLWPDRFQVELLPSLRAMSDQSAQSMEATKALLRHSLRKKLEAALESETYLLIQHWCSAECQTAIRAYLDGRVE